MPKIDLQIPEDLLEQLVARAVAKNKGGFRRMADMGAAEDEEKFQKIRFILDHNGWENPADAYKLAPEDRAKDAIQFTDLVDFLSPDKAKIFFPQVISTVVKEAAEPMLVLSNLFRRISYHGETIKYPAIAASMTPSEIGYGQEYPEGSISGAGVVTAKIAKYGLAFRISEEVLRYSMFDIMQLYYRAAGRSMARFMEKMLAEKLSNELSIAFDNVTPGNALHGQTTGRDLNAGLNGTLTLNDLFVGFADLINQGFIPTDLTMNALGWLIFARSPELRAFGFANGGPMWQSMQGSPGQRPTFDTGGVNLGPSAGVALSGGNPVNNPQASTYANVPSMFPVPFRILVSPFITFDAAAQRTDMYMVDANELGAIIEDEPLSSEAWDDPYRDVRFAKLRMRSGIAIENEGQAGMQFKGLHIARGFDYEDTLTWQTGTGVLPTDTSGV